MPIERGKFRGAKEVRPLTPEEQGVVDKFHELYYRMWREGRFTLDVSWLGYFAVKNPMDLWIYQEIIVETEPDVIIETGTLLGGSALYMATVCDAIGRGEVVTIDTVGSDVTGSVRPTHPLVTYVKGSSTDLAIFESVRNMCEGKRTMVILDSDHDKSNVLAELEKYAPLVSVGCYIIVEDSNVNGHPVYREHGEGPFEAATEFLTGSYDYIVDESRERFMFTCNPNGYLKRVANIDSGLFDAETAMLVAEDALKRGDLNRAVKALENGVRLNPDVTELKTTLDLLIEKTTPGPQEE